MMNSTTENRIPTGDDGFDRILNGGLVRGSAYLVHGPAGAGKTIFANQVCYTVATNGGRALYISLLAESHDRMMAHMSGFEFFDGAMVPSSISYLSAFASLQAGGVAELLRFLFEESRRHDADLVVLDGLFVARDAVADQSEFRAFVHELQGQAALGKRTMLLLTNQLREANTPEKTMVDGGIEFQDDLHRMRAIRSVIVRKQRGGSFLRGRHHFRITDTGLKVFPRFDMTDSDPSRSGSTKPISTGSAGLDAMIGGYPGSSATILAGPTGTGKTTLGLQFLAECTPEAPGILFGFYETPGRLVAKARSIGIDLEALIVSEALDIVWRSPAENLPDEVALHLMAAVRKRGAKRVFFDGIGAFQHAFVHPERLSLVVNAISSALREAEATTLYTMETSGLFMPQQVATGDLSQMVDNVVLMHYVEYRNRLERQLLVLKVRDGAFDPVAEIFHITDRGVVFGRKGNTENRPDGAESASDSA